MLRSIRLKNFRSLRDTGEVELRPIVLLVGANSSGKSSFLRFFPLLKQTVWSRSSSPLLWYLDNGDVDFSDFSNTLFRQAENPWIEFSGTVADGYDISFSSRIACKPNGRSHIQRLTISSFGDTLEITANDDATLRTTKLNGRELDSIVERFAPQRSGPVTRLEGVGINSTAQALLIAKIRTRFTAKIGIEKLEEVADDLGHGDSAYILSMLRTYKLTKKWSNYVESISEESDYVREIKEYAFLAYAAPYIALLEDYIATYARGVRYLGPFRRPPQRFYRRTELPIDEISRDGDNLAMFLDSLSRSDRQAFSTWLHEHFGFGAHTEQQDSHSSLMINTGSGRGFNLMDMGFGISQLLPVVAQCWHASRQRPSRSSPLVWNGARETHPSAPHTMIAIEQPELHLHPQHQAQLANMFRSTINATNSIGQPICLCIETHSEAMIYRFGELVEKGELRREDISILFFEKQAGADESTVRQIEFDTDGVLQNWPIGFFRG